MTYVAGSATSNAQFIFQGYDTATRTLKWTAERVSEDGSVTYKATIDKGAAEFVQPLHNVATIDSAQTLPDVDDSDVYVPTVVAGATATPRITLPPTDTIATDTPAPSSPGFALMLVLLFLATITLVVGFVTPVPVSVRSRRRSSDWSRCRSRSASGGASPGHSRSAGARRPTDREAGLPLGSPRPGRSAPLSVECSAPSDRRRLRRAGCAGPVRVDATHARRHRRVQR